MKPLGVAVVLAVLSGSAAAEWALVSRNTDYLAYADRATRSRTGSVVKMWVLHDQFTAQKIQEGTYLSSEMQNEYDCKNKKWHQIYVLRYTGHMAAGRMFPFNTPNSEWTPVTPASAAEAHWKFACGGR